MGDHRGATELERDASGERHRTEYMKLGGEESVVLETSNFPGAADTSKRVGSSYRLDSKYSAPLVLMLGVLVLSSQGAIFKRLELLGEEHVNVTAGHHNPISPCNVLFVGNLLSTVTFGLVFSKDLGLSKLRPVLSKRMTLLSLIALTIGYCAAQWTTYEAYARSKPEYLVSLALLIELEPIFSLFVTTVCYGERSSSHVYARGLLVVVGVTVTSLIGLASGGFELLPLCLTLLSSFMFGVLQAVGRNFVKDISPGVLLTFRSFVGSWMNFLIAIALFGPSHFSGAFNPFVVWWMFLYSGLIGVLGISAIYAGLAGSSAAVSSSVLSLSVFFKIPYAYIITGVTSPLSSYIGCLIVFVAFCYEMVATWMCSQETTRTHRLEAIDEEDSVWLFRMNITDNMRSGRIST